jgi:hypothetical protein
MCILLFFSLTLVAIVGTFYYMYRINKLLNEKIDDFKGLMKQIEN